MEPFLGDKLLGEFDEYLKKWDAGTLEEDDWRCDWAGKEILKLIRQQLAAKFSPPIESEKKRIDPIR
jgi:hypothetical protein